MDLYALLILTLISLSTTFAECPDKCNCSTEHSWKYNHQVLHVLCDDLQRIPLEVITSEVVELVLYRNNIAVLSNIDEQVENITQLKSLDLSFNDISKIEVNSLRVFNSLENLILSFNNISIISNELFKTLPKLKQLNLNANLYLRLPENGFGTKELEHLDMGVCNLKVLPPKFFDTMPNIKTLNLQINHFSYLGSQLITAFQKMRHVSLFGNFLDVFEPELVTLLAGSDIVIDLRGNSFRCDCPFRLASRLRQFPGMSCVSRHQDTDIDQEIPTIQDCEAAMRETTTIATDTLNKFCGYKEFDDGDGSAENVGT